MGRLSGRVALVTGGGRGIGRAIALAYAHEGADVGLTSRTESELRSVAAEVQGHGGRSFVAAADMFDREAIGRMVGEVIDHFGRLDVLVNNAGGIGGGRTLSDDPDSFERMLFLNFTSAYYATRAAFPQMLRQDYGRVIFIGSGYATHGGGALAYTSAKHALVGMTRALAYQVPKTITVNTLSPGWTNTGLADVDNVARRRGVDPESVRQAMYADSVQRRILEPDEIAPMAVLLGSEEGRAITGQVIGVDGGFRI